MEKSKRKEREFNLRRAEILEEAEKIFASKGFHNTTVAEIAQASGFAIGTIYQFFESKEKLYETMFVEKLNKLYVEISQAVTDAEGFVGKVEALVNSHFRFVENSIEFCNLFIRGESVTLCQGNTILRDSMIEHYLNHVNFVEKFICDDMKKNSLKIEDPKVIAMALIGIIRSFILYWMVSPDGMNLSSKTGQVVDIFLNGVKRREA